MLSAYACIVGISAFRSNVLPKSVCMLQIILRVSWVGELSYVTRVDYSNATVLKTDNTRRHNEERCDNELKSYY